MSLQNRIDAATVKLRRSGGHPHEVHLTKADAVRLQYELLAEGGQVGREIMRDGLQKAVRNIFGLKIVWRSPIFLVV